MHHRYTTITSTRARVRTWDIRFVGPALYPLSYTGMCFRSGGWIRTTTVRINNPLPCRWATPDRAYAARTGLEPARVPGENRVTLPFRPPRPVALLIACRGGRRGRTATGRNPNRFRDGGRRRLSAGSSRGATSVSPGGVEPPTFALSERRSHLLSYSELRGECRDRTCAGPQPCRRRSKPQPSHSANPPSADDGNRTRGPPLDRRMLYP